MPSSNEWRCNHPPGELITHGCCKTCPECGQQRVKIGFEKIHAKKCSSTVREIRPDNFVDYPTYPPDSLCEGADNDGAC
jgi:uncharacterized protein (DUF983 family)